MARDLTVVIPDKEDIVSYMYHINNGVTVHIGVGSLDDKGIFVPQPEQCYKVYEIKGDDLNLLLAPTATKPEGVFRLEDLWPIVDKITIDEEQKKLAEKAAIDAALLELVPKDVKDVKP